MLHSRARAASRVTNDKIEAKAKALCANDGLDPDQNVTHAYGDDFTAQEWEHRWTSNTAIPVQPVVSPMWRLYRARAVVALAHLQRVVTQRHHRPVQEAQWLARTAWTSCRPQHSVGLGTRLRRSPPARSCATERAVLEQGGRHYKPEDM